MNSDEILRRRTALGLTQAALADAVGVHAITVTRWETGKSTPSSLALRLLGETLARLEADAAGRAARRAAYAARTAQQNDAR
jgi:transcriptional regulator with XRE-family HTH domain